MEVKLGFRKINGWLILASCYFVLASIYVINEQQGKSVREVWNGEEPRLSFRRSV
jgi:hypothetical protein